MDSDEILLNGKDQQVRIIGCAAGAKSVIYGGLVDICMLTVAN